MESRENSPTPETDLTAVVPLEIPADVAERADDLLREFAEDAGLETALVVDRSGALVAGISSESDVTINVVSALVAGASGAMRALVAKLGDTGRMESLHLGSDRLVYMGEMVNRFILVGVCVSSRPAGLIRQKARVIRGELSALLKELKPTEERPSAEAISVSGIRPLRDVSRERAVLRLPPPPENPTWATEREDEPKVLEKSGETEVEKTTPSSPKQGHAEPREILEPLDFGEPEIVFEAARSTESGVSDLPGVTNFTEISPFEGDEDSEEDFEVRAAALVLPESIFELEDGEDFGEVNEDFEEEGLEGDGRTLEDSDPPGTLEESGEENIFEVDDPREEEESGEQEISDEIRRMIDDEDQESEVRTSGPFYF